MKNVLICCVIFFLIQTPLHAQLGDLTLDSHQSRKTQIAVGDSSLAGNWIRNWIIGKNYRREWIQPVRVPVLDLNSDFGGLTPKKEGGGKQTMNLQVEDGLGRKWALRSVVKSPEKAIAPILKGTIVDKLFRDGLSASYPYSVLSVGTMARQVNVGFLPNTLVVIPDDPALGEFRPKFKNRLSLLELRSVSGPDGKELKTLDTDELIPKLFESSATEVDQLSVLRSRILDNFILDFDRHEDQWTWVPKDSLGRTFYYPIAKDRDQAFFKITGLLPKLIRPFGPEPGQVQGLRPKLKDANTFNFAARDFDRTFLTELDESTWSAEIDRFLTLMSDATIEEAFKRQPPEVQKFSSDNMVRILKERKQHLKEDLMTYYRYLSKTVSIPGTNDPEQITLTKNDDGTVKVVVERIDSSGAVSSVFYERVFDPNVTEEIRVYGLDGDDRFTIRGGTTPVRIRLIGGPGEDRFVNEGADADAMIYDVSFERNSVTGNFKDRISADPMNNEFRRLGFKYDWSLPFVAFELTREGGLFIGPTFKVIRHGFRKEPYASKHFLYATRAISSKFYHLRYDADFMKIGKKTDLLIRSEAELPTVRTYFYGLGNETLVDPIKGRSYYLARYTLADMSIALKHTLTPWLNLSYGPMMQYFKITGNRNIGKYINALYPTQSSSLYDGMLFAGGEVRVEADLRNHPTFTTRGIYTNLYTRGLKGIAETTRSIGQVGGNLNLYTDFLFPRVIVLATSFGADHNIGSFEFPQAQYLGFKQNMRGYRFQRFAGRTRAYNNSEVRINLGERNFYLFKGYAGLLGFYDTGRVWADGETSSTWHHGYGGGIWVAPMNVVVLSALISKSKEEKNWLQVVFGFQF